MTVWPESRCLGVVHKKDRTFSLVDAGTYSQRLTRLR